MDKDFYYKYSELRLVKHSTSFLDSWNTVNNWGELDWLISEIADWPRSEVQLRLSKCCWKWTKGAAHLVEENILTERWMLLTGFELTLPSHIADFSKRQKKHCGTINCGFKIFSILHRMILFKDGLSFKDWVIQL